MKYPFNNWAILVPFHAGINPEVAIKEVKSHNNCRYSPNLGMREDSTTRMWEGVGAITGIRLLRVGFLEWVEGIWHRIHSMLTHSLLNHYRNCQILVALQSRIQCQHLFLHFAHEVPCTSSALMKEVSKGIQREMPNG